MSSVSTTTYVRKPLYVDVVKVTKENFQQAANWCGGEICDGMSQRSKPMQYIRVKVSNPMTERQEQAHVGDYILVTDKGYKVYTPKAFDANFDQVNQTPLKAYPYPDGNYLVLGPEVFAGDAGGTQSGPADCPDFDTISWKGQNYFTEERINELKNQAGQMWDDAAPNPDQLTTGDIQDEMIARRRILEAEYRQKAAQGHISAEEAEQAIRSLPSLDIEPVGNKPLPKPDHVEVSNPEFITEHHIFETKTDPIPNDIAARQLEFYQKLMTEMGPEPLKPGLVWGYAEDGLITQSQAQDLLGVTQPAVGTLPMPDQGPRDDVEKRDRPPSIPPHMQTDRNPHTELPTDITVEELKRQREAEITGPLRNSATVNAANAAITPELGRETVTYSNADVAAMKHVAGVESIENPTTEEAPLSQPDEKMQEEIRSGEAMIGVDQSQDASLKASIDIDDPSALKAADDEAELTGDALAEDD